MEPLNGIDRVLRAADDWAMSGRKGLAGSLGLLKVGLIAGDEAAKRAFNDIVVLAKAGDGAAKSVVRNVLLSTQGEEAFVQAAIDNVGEGEIRQRLTQQGYDAEELINKPPSSALNAPESTNSEVSSQPVYSKPTEGGIGGEAGREILAQEAREMATPREEDYVNPGRTRDRSESYRMKEGLRKERLKERNISPQTLQGEVYNAVVKELQGDLGAAPDSVYKLSPEQLAALAEVQQASQAEEAQIYAQRRAMTPEQEAELMKRSIGNVPGVADPSVTMAKADDIAQALDKAKQMRPPIMGRYRKAALYGGGTLGALLGLYGAGELVNANQYENRKA